MERKQTRIALEGSIGAGKSTVLRQFNFNPEITLFQEPVNEWTESSLGHNYLKMYYENMHRWGYLFQTRVLTTLVKRANLPFPTPFALYDRSLISCKFFRELLIENGDLRDEELEQLMELEEMMEHKQVDIYVYLRTTPAQCLDRIALRARPEERGISLDYLQRLHDRHEEWVKKEEKPVIVVKAYPPKKPTDLAREIWTRIEGITRTSSPQEAEAEDHSGEPPPVCLPTSGQWPLPPLPPPAEDTIGASSETFETPQEASIAWN